MGVVEEEGWGGGVGGGGWRGEIVFYSAVSTRGCAGSIGGDTCSALFQVCAYSESISFGTFHHCTIKMGIYEEFDVKIGTLLRRANFRGAGGGGANHK